MLIIYIPKESNDRISAHSPGSQLGVYSYGIFHVECSQGLGALSRHNRHHRHEPRLGSGFHYRLRKFLLKDYLKKRTLANESNVMHTQGFDNMIKSLQKHGHKLVLTKTKPEILPILSGIGCDLHVHSDGTDLDVLLKGIL